MVSPIVSRAGTMGGMAFPDEPARSLPQQAGTGKPVDPVKLQALMDDRGLSRLALAVEVTQAASERDIRTPNGELVTCSRDAVSKWLKDQRHPRISTLIALCVALDCTQKDLLYTDTSYGFAAGAVADKLAENTDVISSLVDVIPPAAFAELAQRGYETIADLAQADADGKLNEIPGLVEPPLDMMRRELAVLAGFREDTDEPDA